MHVIDCQETNEVEMNRKKSKYLADVVNEISPGMCRMSPFVQPSLNSYNRSQLNQ